MSELQDNLQEESQEVTEATPSDILGNKRCRGAQDSNDEDAADFY